MGLFNNKKGLELIYGTLIFIVLNLIFIFAVLGFIERANSGASYYEQVYAKEIALMIDSSYQGMILKLNVDELSKFKNPAEINGAILFNDGKVIVRLHSNSKGYSFPYFSDYKIQKIIQEEGGSVFLVINIENDI